MEVKSRPLFYNGMRFDMEYTVVENSPSLTDKGMVELYKWLSDIMVSKATRTPAETTPAVTTTRVANACTTQSVPSVPDPEIGTVEIPSVTLTEPKPTTPPATAYTAEQKASMKTLKIRLGIKDNQEFNIWIQRWSQGHLTSVNQLHPTNIDDFIAYMQTAM